MEAQLLDMTEFDPATYRFFETVEYVLSEIKLMVGTVI